MVLRIILYIVGFVGVVGFTHEREPIPAVLCAAILIVPALVQLWKARQLKPSAMICPNCGSADVFISERFEGMTTDTDVSFKRSFVFPNHRAKVQSQAGAKINRQRVARCRQCGFDYRYTTAGEVQREQSDAIKATAIAGAALALSVLLGLAAK